MPKYQDKLTGFYPIMNVVYADPDVPGMDEECDHEWSRNPDGTCSGCNKKVTENNE
jgi:hypothetical protein